MLINTLIILIRSPRLSAPAPSISARSAHPNRPLQWVGPSVGAGWVGGWAGGWVGGFMIEMNLRSIVLTPFVFETRPQEYLGHGCRLQAAFGRARPHLKYNKLAELVGMVSQDMWAPKA